MLWFFIGSILGFVLGFFIYGVRYYLKKSKNDNKNIVIPDFWIDKARDLVKEFNNVDIEALKKSIDKKHMEEELKLKLEKEEALKKVDEETFKKILNTVK